MAPKNNENSLTLKEKLDFILKLLFLAIVAFAVYSYNCNASKWGSKKCYKGKRGHHHYKKSSSDSYGSGEKYRKYKTEKSKKEACGLDCTKPCCANK